MTREKAIKLIQNLIDQMNENGYAEIDSFHEDALLMAIKTLEQEPCDKCVYSTKDGYCQYDDIIETIPPFDLCEDVISRKE